MTNPFPGMNPYLESRWQDVHHSLCTYARDALQPQLRPTLKARVEEVAAGVADVAEPLILRFASEPRTEGFVQVLDPANGNAIVTVIEFLSPSSKNAGGSREQYGRKRDELYDGGVSLVEIDLLRSGRWPFSFSEFSVPRSHRAPYRVCTHRGRAGPEYHIFHLPLELRLPRIPIPLRAEDADAVLDLQALIDQAYINGAYDEEFDYAADADPPLTGEAAAWADGLLRTVGRRV